MKFRINSGHIDSLHLMSYSEKLRLVLDYIRTGQLKKLFHLTLESAIKSHILDGPENLSVEPTWFCNASCSLCTTPARKIKRNKKMLPMNQYKEIINSIKNCVRIINFFVAGEPLMNDNLHKMIHYATKNGLRTFVSTNGTLLDETKINEILESKLDVLTICLDGANKVTQEITRKGANFELVCKNIQKLTSKKRKTKKVFPYIFIQTLITRYNENQLEETDRSISMELYWVHIINLFSTKIL